MIDETVKIHDKFQFELKFNYKLEENQLCTRYRVETYFFIPKSLGVDSSNYSKKNFYQDIQSYIRLKTPEMLLKNISGEDGVVRKLREGAEILSVDPSEKNREEFKYRLKMFCSILKSALRDEMDFITKQAGKDLGYQMQQYLENSNAAVKEFRKLKKLINVPTFPGNLLKLYFFADEYISIILNEYRHALYEFAEESSAKKSADTMDMILKEAKDEISYRKDAGYPSIPNDESDNETIIYRRSALKKLIGRILFLNRTTKKEGTMAEQLLFGFAAGLAMAFATSVAFLSKNKFEDLTVAFFIIVVVAYIFKDRMKDILRNYISTNLQKYFFDRNTRIFSNFGHKIGVLRENFSFVREENLPKTIVDLRNRDYLAGINDGIHYGEEIMLYKKEISLISERFKNIFKDFKINGINDIIRMNISSFLSKMDNPDEDVYIPKKSEYIKVSGSRVYHINILIKYSVAKEKSQINRFRIVLNRNGIKRIEEVK